MNTHSIAETIRSCLLQNYPELAIHTPISNGELVAPYALLNCMADEELIPGNRTWECSLVLSLHSVAHDEAETTMREQFSSLCATLGRKTTLEGVNKAAPDFMLYSLSLRSIEEPQAQDNDFTQTATFRVVAQF